METTHKETGKCFKNWSIFDMDMLATENMEYVLIISCPVDPWLQKLGSQFLLVKNVAAANQCYTNIQLTHCQRADT